MPAPISLLRVGAVHLASIAVIAAVWAPVADEDIFVAIRDNLLLTHPWAAPSMISIINTPFIRRRPSRA
ncbi:MAG: hypothetical protein R2875_04300 [Desulfobacterales bacterium]